MFATRRTFLPIAAAAIALLGAADTASAQETADQVDVRAEPGGGACNPCTATVTGEHHIIALPSGVRAIQCNDFFALRMFGAGQSSPPRGELEWSSINDNPPPNCTSTNCAAPENHWPVTNIGEVGGGAMHMTVRFCIRTGAGETHCNAELTVTNTATPHRYMYSTIAICAGGARRIEGEWLSTTGTFELVHAVD